MLNLDWWGAPAIALVQRKSDTQKTQQQATVVVSPPQEINLISCGPLAHISDIKLIRTDTTLDLSQKAEKGMLFPFAGFGFYTTHFLCFVFGLNTFFFQFKINLIFFIFIILSILCHQCKIEIQIFSFLNACFCRIVSPPHKKYGLLNCGCSRHVTEYTLMCIKFEDKKSRR